MSRQRRVFSREFKEAAVQRIVAGEKVAALAAELGLWPKLLYDWWSTYDRFGAEALQPPGRPPRTLLALRRAAARRAQRAPRQRHATPADRDAEAQRVAELERKVGQQALELDFFARALRRITASRPPSGAPGATASSPSSRR